MKKFLTMGALALALTALTTQSAPAWINSKFGIGLNWNYQSGGNNALFGLWRNGQPPAPDCGVGYPGVLPYGPGPAPAPYGFVAPTNEQGVTGQESAQPANTVPAHTQSGTRNYYNSQMVNYQYPYQYQYNSYYNYYR